ncbi:ABC-2 family transporter protein [Metabacillus halosaccharovorans]|nr:ABC-2 family transporter protein [Metabacillus halosaccharovorans]
MWKALYSNSEVVKSISIDEMVTYSILGMIMRTLFTMDEFYIDRKVVTGQIAIDFLKPISFALTVFSNIIGQVAFNLVVQVIPVLIISIFIFDFNFPQNPVTIALYFCSLMLGFLILFTFNMIIWSMTFWVHKTYSIVTIKNSIISLISGLLIPLWFIPEGISKILSFLPFQYIYFTPLNIFLEKSSLNNILLNLLMQMFWGLSFFIISIAVWKIGLRKMVIQGG